MFPGRVVLKHDDNRIKKALVKYFIVGEHPFSDVCEESFVELVSALNGRVKLPSRHTISRLVSKTYLEERKVLQRFFTHTNVGIHLTTDTWTSSCQRKIYMVVTAHFIDESWKMHKRIINFREIESHKGEEIGRELLDCIHGWKLRNVITLTVDNASANFTAIAFLAKHLPDVYENGKHLHVKCMAHILNLIVKDDFKYQNYHIDCIQRAVKYVRQTPQRIAKFKKAMKEVGLEKKPFLCGESPTRWNSTFEVLQKSLSLQEAFMKYAIQDKELEREVGRVPNNSDFKAISNMVKFLEKFKIKTEIVSTSTRPVVNQFLGEVLDVDIHLRKWGLVSDFMHIVIEMRDKYDKYWGDYDKFNDYTLFAVLLDPILKSQLLLHLFKTRITQLDPKNEKTNSTKDLEVYALLRGVESRLEKLYKYYVERYDTGESSKKHSQNEELFHAY